MCFVILHISFSVNAFLGIFVVYLKFKSNARETWCVILVSASWHLLFRITALYTPFRSAQNHCLPDNVRPRGAFISVGDWTPTEKYLLLLTTCRSGSLNSDWGESPLQSVRNYLSCYLLFKNAPAFLLRGARHAIAWHTSTAHLCNPAGGYIRWGIGSHHWY